MPSECVNLHVYVCEREERGGEKRVERKGEETEMKQWMYIGIIGEIWFLSVAELETRSRGRIKAAGQMHKKPSHLSLRPDTDPSCPTPPNLTNHDHRTSFTLPTQGSLGYSALHFVFQMMYLCCWSQLLPQSPSMVLLGQQSSTCASRPLEVA